MSKLSILIPARQEIYLKQTIDDIFKHAEGDIEVLVGLDGLEENDIDLVALAQIKYTQKKLQFVINEKPMGQRAMTNYLAQKATGDYLMKLDAHCSLSQGFDVELLKLAKEATVVVPALTNLHCYDWICDKGHRKNGQQFEDKKCEQCGEEMKKELVWKPIPKPVMTNYYFDTNLHFQYCEEQDEEHFETETMSIQGSCFMISKKDYWDLEVCDEKFGNWGQQGTEVSCKVWLSGGRIISTRNCFYSHWFRTFPYENPVDKILKVQEYSRDLFLNNKWSLQKKPIQWLIEKFDYPGDWSAAKVKELCAKWERQ
jgi:glycosyltransferase involved in cell wall biosynthesis